MRAVVICANGWSAGWCGCYGNEWVATPNLDRLAVESIVFDQHFAVNPSPDSHSHSVASGRYVFTAEDNPSAHGASLVLSLRKYGIRTVRVHDLAHSARLNDRDESQEWDESVAVPVKADVSRGEALFGLVAEKLEELADVEEWLLWVETDRLLPPWTVSADFFEEYARDMVLSEEEDRDAPPEPWSDPARGKMELSGGEYELLHGTFAAMVSEWDAELGEWVDLFRELGLDESAVWVVTSGYGLSLGEHDWIGPDSERIHEELVHVPLLLRLPGADEAGRRVPLLTESIDLLPSLLDAFGHPVPAGLHGTSLLPLAGGSLLPLRDSAIQGLPVEFGGFECGLRTPEWACLLSAAGGDNPPLLFRKPEDRWEVNDVRQQHLEWAEYLEKTVRDFMQTVGSKNLVLPKLREYSDVVTSPS